MQAYAQTVARLKSMTFLLEEAMRIADEGGNALLGAKISDCVDWLDQEMQTAGAAARARAERDGTTRPQPAP